MAPGPLAQVLRQLPSCHDENLLSRDIPFADAGVYRLTSECALVQSVDFFTPVVNDPRTFGRIAAANALSDIYAMGAKPLTVMNLVAFPSCLPQSVLTEILQGGAEKIQEAGAIIVGGHTIEDDEPKYGLSVTGLVDPRQLISTVGALPGDRLLLTKPLGTGILVTALKGEVITEADMRDAITGMQTLNRTAAEIMGRVGVNACTDITGFGLLGHALELAAASRVGLEIQLEALRLYPLVAEMAALGLIPAGSYHNRQHYLPQVRNGTDIPPELVDLLADPQTSGGLLLAVTEPQAERFRQELIRAGCDAFFIGTVSDGPPGTMRMV
jgi:selenide, water dikinase